jgi:hypothetical protein
VKSDELAEIAVVIGEFPRLRKPDKIVSSRQFPRYFEIGFVVPHHERHREIVIFRPGCAGYEILLPLDTIVELMRLKAKNPEGVGHGLIGAGDYPVDSVPVVISCNLQQTVAIVRNKNTPTRHQVSETFLRRLKA